MSSKNSKYLDFCRLSGAEMRQLAMGTTRDRAAAVVPLSTVTKEKILLVQPMTFLQEVATVLFLTVGAPNGVVTLPILTLIVGKFVLGNIPRAFGILGLLLLPLAILPQPFVYERLHSWMAVQVVRYFSFRFIYQELPPSQRPGPKTSTKRVDNNNPEDSSAAPSVSSQVQPNPQILVAPPHGVFPYGNVLAMLAWPSLCGNHFQGLAANSALRVPIFKQVLRGIGVIDASRSSARRALTEYPYTIGISTGGVAEVFETNVDDECILLKERIGLIKLAIRTGADLVPCYLFGNTQLLSCWAGNGVPGVRRVLEWLSRRVLGFALVVFYGRWGLPVPRRVPVLAVLGKPIPTRHLQCEEPDSQLVQKLQLELITAMQTLFDDHKHLYGWEHKHLIIK